MGLFHETVVAVNRTSKQLEVVFDGQRMFLEPNYTATGELIEGVVNTLPVIAIPYALNQNVLMGSEDSIDPSAFQSLVGIRRTKKDRKAYSWHDCSYLEQSEELTRTPLADVLEDPSAKIVVRGRVIPRSVDANMPGVTTPFDPR